MTSKNENNVSNSSNERYTIRNFANLVTRRDYSKQFIDFQEPDLLEIQKKSYRKFINHDLKNLISSYFPIKHVKNLIYEVQCGDIKFYDTGISEEEARLKNKTYGKNLYVDFRLVNNETGEIKQQKICKHHPHPGIFFGLVPTMTKNGTFIINGVEKIVISQTVRAPGAYILSKSQIKMAKKKKISEGYICEILPFKGTLMNFIIDKFNHNGRSKQIIKVIARNATGESAETLSVTQMLKAFGFNANQILSMFSNAEIILNSLLADGIDGSYSSKFPGCYTREKILKDSDIIKLKKIVTNFDSEDELISKHIGSPIDIKIKSLIFNYYQLEKKVRSDLSQKEKNSVLNEMNKILDLLICEKAAMDIINQLSISKRQVENLVLTYNNKFSYQDFFVRYFCEKKQFNLSATGRIKLNHKLRISERLYQKTLAEDIFYKTGKLFLKKDTLITKDELDSIKKALNNNELDLTKSFSLLSKSIFSKKGTISVESISVYADNDEYDDFVNVVGIKPIGSEETLTIADIIAVISYTINLPWNIGIYDDIDHLGNKYIKLIDQQLYNKLVVGMAKVEKHIKDMLSSLVTRTMNEEQRKERAKKATLTAIINYKPFEQSLNSFFNTYQLTQFIDQQNPLSELTNKRRISAMGDGGIRRDDPNLDVRDVHYSHYGRICPIETPEGQNIGLIMSLANYAKVDEYGFIVAPYLKVVNRVITNEIVWLNASSEDEYIIAESLIKRDKNNRIIEQNVVGRYRGVQEIYSADQIDFVDVNQKQVISVAASAIPFIENDDSARALMGANMQRQAVPLLRPYAPIVGTGSEYKIAHDSGLGLLSDKDGVIKKVDSKSIIVENADNTTSKYKLVKFRKTNQNTCNNQLPIVEVGQKIKQDQVIADGPAMFNGELAIGRNPLIAYTTWQGYNFEDAIIVSDRLIKQDIFTSISIDEITCNVIQTKNGDEEVTRDIPNVSEASKGYLNKDGIIMVGADVKEGDILIGKISPKGVVEYSSEEKLLNQIFGIKSRPYRDTSVRVKHGEGGTVIGVQHLRSVDGEILDQGVIEQIKIYIAQKRKLQIGDKMSGRHGNKGTISKIVPVEDMPYLADGTPIDILLSPLGVPSRMNIGQILEVHLGWAMRNIARKQLFELITANSSEQQYCQLFGLSVNKANILKNIAKKYLLANKIDSLEKFTNIHLSVILEKCGLDIEDLSLKASTPVFNGAKLDDISAALKEVGINAAKTKGKSTLYDGRTGEKFEADITVGVMYMLKLDHMVEDKIHARAIGPYSRVNQQPLGGKNQNGGQRFGEMEVWGLEAYGACYNLQELLTIKSDDRIGRNRTYNAIIHGRDIPKSSIPTSFKLLTKELQGLCLGLTIYDQNDKSEDINDFFATKSSDSFISDLVDNNDDTDNIDNNNDDDEDHFNLL